MKVYIERVSQWKWSANIKETPTDCKIQLTPEKDKLGETKWYTETENLGELIIKLDDYEKENDPSGYRGVLFDSKGGVNRLLIYDDYME